MHISSTFECGNAAVVSAKTPDDIRIKLVPDAQSEFYQWFYFSLSTESGKPHCINILELKKSAYPEGWRDYCVHASYDRQTWFCIPTSFDGDTLTIQFTPEKSSVFLAYSPPYTFERHQDRVHAAQQSPRCAVTTIGRSLEGRAIHMLTIGEAGPNKRKCWFIGRQHSGETMAEWFSEGVVERLLDAQDPVARVLLDQAVFYIVPNMNPDGTVRGHQRLNAAGIDLNREWMEPTPDRSPEVLCVRQQMHAWGVDFCMDAHGDENIPYVFLAARTLTERSEVLRNRFRAAFLEATPEFQTTHGYTADPATPVNMAVAVNYIGTTFDCVSFTLEMPFKDNQLLPDPQHGWSSARSKKLGADCLVPLLNVVGDLR